MYALIIIILICMCVLVYIMRRKIKSMEKDISDIYTYINSHSDDSWAEIDSIGDKYDFIINEYNKLKIEIENLKRGKKE